jgi:hypothetical protein
MLAFLSMHCGFWNWKFHKLHWASTLNQKHIFVITSLSTTQFEYAVKFSMEIQIFRKIMEFSSHFPSLLCSRTSIVQAWGRSHYIIFDKCYVSIMLQKFWGANEKNEKWKKNDEKKRKVRKKGRRKKKKER